MAVDINNSTWPIDASTRKNSPTQEELEDLTVINGSETLYEFIPCLRQPGTICTTGRLECRSNSDACPRRVNGSSGW